MPLKDAITFIRFAREQRDQLGITPEHTSLADLVALGAQHDYVFTVDELREAFKHDWGLRWLAQQMQKRAPRSG